MSLEQATKDPCVLRIYDYWNERGRGRPFPKLDDLDPAEYAYAAERVSLVEVHRDPLRFRYRVVSPQLTAHLGYDMTGKYVEDVPEPSMREFTRAFYLRALDRRAPFHETGRALIRLEEWWHETLALPLASDGETIDFLLIYRNTAPPTAVAGRPAEA